MRTTGDVEPQKFISLLQKKTWQKKVIQDLKFKYRTSKICKAKESLGFEGEQMAEAWALLQSRICCRQLQLKQKWGLGKTGPGVPRNAGAEQWQELS